MKANILYICLLTAVFTACGGRRDVERRLDEADAMMDCEPDSALTLLKAMCCDSLGAGQRARYALLRTKAEVKNYKPVEDDSLISFAAEYYSGRGDSLEAQSLFYLGYYNAEKRISDKALVLFSRSYEAALAAHDIFYAAMSAREMSLVYRRLLMVDESLKWDNLAKQLFAEAGKPIHAAWMDNMIANDLIFSGNLSGAKELLDSITNTPLYDDISFRKSTIINLIELALQVDSYKEVLNQYDRLSADNYVFTAHDRLNQAKAAMEEGMLDDADSYLAMARELTMSEADSLYEGKLLSKLYAARGETMKAYDASTRFSDKLMSSDARRISKPQTQLLTDNYKLNADIHRLQAEKNRAYIIGLIIVCLLLGTLIYIIYRYYKSSLKFKVREVERLIAASQILQEDLMMSNTRYNKLSEENSTLKTSIAGKENEIKNLMAESHTLNDNLAESENRYRDMSDENSRLRSSMAGKDAGFEKEIRGVFSCHLELVNDLCRVWFTNVNKDMYGNTVFMKFTRILGALREIEVIEKLARVIDKYDNNWVARFRKSYPYLKDSEYRLAIYLYLGFHPSTIAVLLDLGTLQGVYKAKFNLKHKLINSGKALDESLISPLFSQGNAL